MSHRPIILGIVGDSAAGKTTLSRGIAQILGELGRCSSSPPQILKIF
jgi:uridine kinase